MRQDYSYCKTLQFGCNFRRSILILVFKYKQVMTLVNLSSGLIAFFLFALSFCSAQQQLIRNSVIQIINQHLSDYPLSFDNQLRLAIYTDLKGKYDAPNRRIVLDFGDYGDISLYENNCLIRTPNATLNLNKNDLHAASKANKLVGGILEKLMLFSNHQANPAHVAFVDQLLARKNIEAFHKIFTRHVLLKYGKYHAGDRVLIFHTDYISPSADFNQSLIKKHKTPLKIILNQEGLKGYYLRTGGEVYLEDSRKKLWYATSEGTNYNNVTAYKLFIQSLITQTIPYISKEESNRQKKIKQMREVVKLTDDRKAHPSRYQGDEWIVMMLGALRANDISPSDPYILRHLSRQDYFQKVYKHMTVAEKKAADRYKTYGWYLGD